MENQARRSLALRILTLLVLLFIAGALAYSAKQVSAEEAEDILMDQFAVTRITCDCSYYTDQELPSFENSHGAVIKDAIKGGGTLSIGSYTNGKNGV